jgi:hypothetical protein
MIQRNEAVARCAHTAKVIMRLTNGPSRAPRGRAQLSKFA